MDSASSSFTFIESRPIPIGSLVRFNLELTHGVMYPNRIRLGSHEDAVQFEARSNFQISKFTLRIESFARDIEDVLL